MSSGQAADLDQGVGEDAVSAPGSGSGQGGQFGAVPSVAAFEVVDPAFASGSPFDLGAERFSVFELSPGGAVNRRVGQAFARARLGIPGCGGRFSTVLRYPPTEVGRPPSSSLLPGRGRGAAAKSRTTPPGSPDNTVSYCWYNLSHHDHSSRRCGEVCDQDWELSVGGTSRAFRGIADWMLSSLLGDGSCRWDVPV